jgi:hypothetical protein
MEFVLLGILTKQDANSKNSYYSIVSCALDMEDFSQTIFMNSVCRKEISNVF